MIYVKRVLLLALVALIAVFAFQNHGNLGKPVDLYFFRYGGTLPVGLWLVISFAAGCLLFVLLDLPRIFSLKREVSRKSGELARAQFELTRAQAQIQQYQAQGPAGGPPPGPVLPSPQAGDIEKRLGL